MSLGFGGGSSTQRNTSTTTSTTPWTQIASDLAKTLKTNLGNLASGSSISQGIDALTKSSELATKTGIANLKEAFGASGMRFSTALAKNISDFQTSQSTALNTQIAQFQQGAVQNQLNALMEIISLATGSGTQSSTGKTTGDQFGWNFAVNLLQPGK